MEEEEEEEEEQKLMSNPSAGSPKSLKIHSLISFASESKNNYDNKRRYSNKKEITIEPSSQLGGDSPIDTVWKRRVSSKDQ